MNVLGHSRYAILAAAAACVLVGCKVGPDYVRPNVMTPKAFAATRPTTAPTTAPTTQPGAVVELTHWWDALGDPQLTALIAKATESNLDLGVAKARVREARAQRGVSASSGQPQANVNGSYSRSLPSNNGANAAPPGGFNDEDLYTGGINASWELDIFGGLKRQVESADAEILFTVENLRDILLSLQADVATNYINLRAAQGRLIVARNAVVAQRQSAELARSRFNAGLASELDVQRAEAQVATTESQIPVFEATIRASMHRLGVLLGRGPADLIPELEMEKVIPVPVADIPAGQPGDLLRRRPDIRRAEANLWAATANIGAAKAELYPRFSLVGDLGLQSTTFRHWWDADSRFWSVGPQVSWSVLNGGRVNANIQVQTERQQQALLQYQQTILLGVEEVENGLTRYATEQRRRDVLQRAVNANQRALELATELYTRGLTDFTAVIDAERDLYTTQDQLVGSQGNVTNYAITVYRALGGGWVIPAGPAIPTTQPTVRPTK